MINSKGEDTSILFGFTKYLLELIIREHPTHLAVAFDPPAETFRHKACKEYKANRSASPELVKASLDPLIEIVRALNIPVVMKPGFEADDVIGSMAKQYARDGFLVYMVTPDKDLGQIISDNIYQYKPGKSGSENEIIGKKEICEKYGIDDPEQIIDILTLWGDSSDNVEGVRGIGEVGAKKLISKYKSVENILQHLDELPEKQQVAFKEAEPHIQLSKFLVTIKTDIDLGLDEHALENDVTINDKVISLFGSHEFSSLLPLLPKENSTGLDRPSALPEEKCLEIEQCSPEILCRSIQDSGEAAFMITDDGELILSIGKKYNIFSLNDPGAGDILENRNIRKIGFAIKSQLNRLKNAGINVSGELYDIELLHYLINPERTHKIEFLIKSYLDCSLKENVQKGEKQLIQGDLFSSTSDTGNESERKKEDENEGIRECVGAGLVAPLLIKELTDNRLMDLYLKIEMPLIYVLAAMEFTGVCIDTGQLAEYGTELTGQMLKIENEVRQMAEEPDLNLSSPKQVGIVLYEKLGLNPNVKRNKRDNYPTDEETLTSISDKHPIINKILEFRALKKLISTYIEPLPSLIDPKTGKVHTTFTQALTATGRLSSIKPNLQNIPVRTEMGREIRKAFIPERADGFIVSADYSQIELRIMAHLSGDESLIADFKHGDDIHAATAAKIFKIPKDEVTTDQRRKAKTANFGIIYGISSFGLSQRLNIPRRESKELIDEYFNNYPKVREYIEKVKTDAREKGYVETIFGRKRFLPDINSRNQVVRGLAERNAVNAPIQGSAADIIKLAMINTFRRLEKEKMESRMVLQVHDELVFDVKKDEREEIMRIAREEMETVCTLAVPLVVDCNYGKNWLEAH